MHLSTRVYQVNGNQWRKRIMKRAMIFASVAMMSVALLSGGARAQGTPQTVELVKVDVQKLAAGYRASKVIGSSVVNDANETIGTLTTSWWDPTVSSHMRYYRSAAFWGWAHAWLSSLMTV